MGRRGRRKKGGGRKEKAREGKRKESGEEVAWKDAEKKGRTRRMGREARRGSTDCFQVQDHENMKFIGKNQEERTNVYGVFGMYKYICLYSIKCIISLFLSEEKKLFVVIIIGLLGSL